MVKNPSGYCFQGYSSKRKREELKMSSLSEPVPVVVESPQSVDTVINNSAPSASNTINNENIQPSEKEQTSSSSATASAPDTPNAKQTNDANNTKKDDSMFECNICLDTAKEAVVSMCGHLFCWPCLHQWLETRPTRQLCPVCKAAISKEKVIPLYGRGSTKEEDPRAKVPPRPAGQRTEPEPNNFQGFGFGDGGFQMSLGIGAFPFGIFTSTFNFGGNPRSQNTSAHVLHDEDQFLSKAFLWVTILFLAWLILA